MSIFSSRKATPINYANISKARLDFPPKGSEDVEGRNIAVFTSAKDPKNKIFAQHATRLGLLMGERGHNLVWGATDAGMMKLVALNARSRGSKLLGVGFVDAKDGDRNTAADILFGANSISERKSAMLDLADIAIAMAGGIGTIDEIGTVFESKKGFNRMPPLILLNSDGYYGGLIEQFDRMSHEGTIYERPSDLFRVAETPEEAIELAETLEPPKYTNLQDFPTFDLQVFLDLIKREKDAEGEK